jgi:2-methylcitrate dehydratase PrpD
VDEPKGDPGNTLTKEELEAKAVRLAEFRGGASSDEIRTYIAGIWKLDTAQGGSNIVPWSR